MGSIRFQTRDPRERVEVGDYLEDGERMVEVLEVDLSGALGLDVRTRFNPDDRRPGDIHVPEELVEIDPVDLMQKWRLITPLRDS